MNWLWCPGVCKWLLYANSLSMPSIIVPFIISCNEPPQTILVDHGRPRGRLQPRWLSSGIWSRPWSLTTLVISLSPQVPLCCWICRWCPYARNASTRNPLEPTTARCATAACSRWTTTAPGSTTASAIATTGTSSFTWSTRSPAASTSWSSGSRYLFSIYMMHWCGGTKFLYPDPYLASYHLYNNAEGDDTPK